MISSSTTVGIDASWSCSYFSVQLQMLGYDISWAAFNIIEVMSSTKFTFKRIGYLAASQCFNESTEVGEAIYNSSFNSPLLKQCSHYGAPSYTQRKMISCHFVWLQVLMLTTNMIRKDLNSHNQYESGVALTGLACFVSPDLARDLANDIMSLVSTVHLSWYIPVFCRIISRIKNQIPLFLWPVNVDQALSSEEGHPSPLPSLPQLPRGAETSFSPAKREAGGPWSWYVHLTSPHFLQVATDFTSTTSSCITQVSSQQRCQSYVNSPGRTRRTTCRLLRCSSSWWRRPRITGCWSKSSNWFVAEVLVVNRRSWVDVITWCAFCFHSLLVRSPDTARASLREEIDWTTDENHPQVSFAVKIFQVPPELSLIVSLFSFLARLRCPCCTSASTPSLPVSERL